MRRESNEGRGVGKNAEKVRMMEQKSRNKRGRERWSRVKNRDQLRGKNEYGNEEEREILITYLEKKTIRHSQHVFRSIFGILHLSKLEKNSHI